MNTFLYNGPDDEEEEYFSKYLKDLYNNNKDIFIKDNQQLVIDAVQTFIRRTIVHNGNTMAVNFNIRLKYFVNQEHITSTGFCLMFSKMFIEQSTFPNFFKTEVQKRLLECFKMCEKKFIEHENYKKMKAQLDEVFRKKTTFEQDDFKFRYYLSNENDFCFNVKYKEFSLLSMAFYFKEFGDSTQEAVEEFFKNYKIENTFHKYNIKKMKKIDDEIIRQERRKLLRLSEVQINTITKKKVHKL